MTPIEKQILKNQATILLTQTANAVQQDLESLDSIRNRLGETEELLNPTKSNEPACDMSERPKKYLSTNPF